MSIQADKKYPQTEFLKIVITNLSKKNLGE